MRYMHNTKRCAHGFADGLCVVAGCAHVERPAGRQASAAKLRATLRCSICRRAVPRETIVNTRCKEPCTPDSGERLGA